MDPRTLILMAGSTGLRKRLGTVLWQGSNDSSVTVTPGSTTYTVAGNSDGEQTYGDLLPAITSTGFFLDVQLETGYSNSPTRVAWLGVCNTTAAINSGTAPRPFTGWYWSGAMWYPGGETSSTSALVAGDYRIALRTESGVNKIYFKRINSTLIRGPIDVPSGNLRLMIMGQGGFLLPVATILYSGAVFEGGGGLFSPTP
jgi:hypothetical protein